MHWKQSKKCAKKCENAKNANAFPPGNASNNWKFSCPPPPEKKICKVLKRWMVLGWDNLAVEAHGWAQWDLQVSTKDDFEGGQLHTWAHRTSQHWSQGWLWTPLPPQVPANILPNLLPAENFVTKRSRVFLEKFSNYWSRFFSERELQSGLEIFPTPDFLETLIFWCPRY